MRNARHLSVLGLFGGGSLVIAAAASLGACHGGETDTPMCMDSTGCQEPEPATQNEPTFVSKVRPPAVTGGTLLVTHDGKFAIASDPDRDRIVVVDTAAKSVAKVFDTDPGAEPARAVEDAAGRVHVALRNTGELFTIDLETLEHTASTAVCPAPRGVAFDAESDHLLVACEGGELVTLAAGSRAGEAVSPPSVTSSKRYGDDLRDVIVSGSDLLLTRFRSASLLTLHRDGTSSESQPSTYRSFLGEQFAPTVAWRTVKLVDGRVLMLHQNSKVDMVALSLPSTPPGGSDDGSGDDGSGGEQPPPSEGSSYGGTIGGCVTGIVHGAVSAYAQDGSPLEYGGGQLAGMTVPVDVAVSPTGTIAVVAAGSQMVIESSPDSLLFQDNCANNVPGPIGFSTRHDPAAVITGDGTRAFATSPEPIAAAYLPTGALLIQTREPSRIEFHDLVQGNETATVELGGESRLDSGHRLFHGNPEVVQTGIACASCHPEGRDDGHVWNFSTVGARRTQSLVGFSTDTAPFHWDGDQLDIGALMDDVFVNRMGGTPQSDERKEAIQSWLNQLPLLPARAGVDAAAAERGRALFENADVACATCHSGEHLTNSTSVDVSTGGKFQVPSLVGVGSRSPFMHDGCAPTLRDRFTNLACGGGDSHGHTTQLADADIDDLVAYLETL